MSLDVASPAPRLLSRLLALRDLGRYPVLRAGGALDVIEIGAGLGDAAALVADELPVNRLALFELSARARRVLSERFDGDARVTIARDVLVGTDRFDLALCFEVMEHVEDDAEFLGTIRDRLHGTGLFIGSVPAHARLWGAGDVLAGHFRRYDEPVLRERLDDLLRSGRHDERVATRPPVTFEQPLGLGPNALDQPRQDLCIEAHQVDLSLTDDRSENPLADLVAGVVAGTEQLERDRATCVAHEFVGRYETDLARLDCQRECGRPGDQRAVEVKEGGRFRHRGTLCQRLTLVNC